MHYIYVPGLGSAATNQKQQKVVDSWVNVKQQRTVQYLNSRWADKSEPLEQKIQRLLADITSHQPDTSKPIALVGSSAGGTLGLNLYIRLCDMYDSVHFVSICGKITGPDAIGSHYSQPHPALIPSVLLSESLIPTLSQEKLQNILNIKPLFDEVVGTKYMAIKGANSLRVPLLFHAPSIFITIKLLRHKIFNFCERV